MKTQFGKMVFHDEGIFFLSDFLAKTLKKFLFRFAGKNVWLRWDFISIFPRFSMFNVRKVRSQQRKMFTTLKHYCIVIIIVIVSDVKKGERLKDSDDDVIDSLSLVAVLWFAVVRSHCCVDEAEKTNNNRLRKEKDMKIVKKQTWSAKRTSQKSQLP